MLVVILTIFMFLLVLQMFSESTDPPGRAFRYFYPDTLPPLPPSQWTPGIPVESQPEPAGAARSRPEPAGVSQISFFVNFDVILGHVLAVKPHISIQNMIWDHPHGGKTHEESFFHTLQPPKHRFR